MTVKNARTSPQTTPINRSRPNLAQRVPSPTYDNFWQSA